MRTRIIQTGPEPPEPPPSRARAGEPARPAGIAARMGRWSAEHRRVAILGWLAFVAAAVMLGNAVGQEKIQGADGFSGESHRAEQALYGAGLRPNDEHVLIQSGTLTVDDPPFRAAIADAERRLSRAGDVRNVVSPLSGDAPVSADRRSALVDFEITGDSLEAAKRLGPSKQAIEAVQDEHPALRVEQFGNVSSNKELNDIFSSDLGKAELLSFPLTLLILVIAFGSLVAALVPLLLGVSTVLAALGLIALPSQISPIDGNLQSVILLIGLAVSVDYSLFYLRREREERAAGRSARSALEVAASTSGRAVLISGLTVIAAMAGMFLTGDKTFISFAQGTILVVAIAIVSSLTVLPAVLAWLGDRVERGRIPFLGRHRRPAGQSRIWSAIVVRVMRRPWLAILVAGGLLVALAIPAVNMNIAITSVDDLPQDLAVIQTYDRLREAFPKEGVTVDVAVEADDVRSGAVAAGIAELRREAEGTENVLKGSEVEYSRDGTVALVAIPTAGNGNDDESIGALGELRGRVIPATIGSVDGASVHVSGNAAQSQDFRDLVKDRLPLVFAFVFSLAFLLMLFTFRSIVIPIKAILLNLLSVGAAYGVLVLVFQDGHAEGALGFTSNGGVTSWLPLFLFVILFGLSMDYHIFILSRVREAHRNGMTTAEAVRHGISSTAGTVTSAAVVMVVVFSIFVTLGFLDFKEMGVGLAVAVLIDATVVRGVLLPASMKVLGDWNWYLPSWLEWLPRVGGGHEAPPPPANAPASEEAPVAPSPA
jgi:RND superfamily putative drug exporter